MNQFELLKVLLNLWHITIEILLSIWHKRIIFIWLLFIPVSLQRAALVQENIHVLSFHARSVETVYVEIFFYLTKNWIETCLILISKSIAQEQGICVFKIQMLHLLQCKIQKIALHFNKLTSFEILWVEEHFRRFIW